MWRWREDLAVPLWCVGVMCVRLVRGCGAGRGPGRAAGGGGGEKEKEWFRSVLATAEAQSGALAAENEDLRRSLALLQVGWCSGRRGWGVWNLSTACACAADSIAGNGRLHAPHSLPLPLPCRLPCCI